MFWCDSVPPLARPAWPAAESVTQSVLVRPDPGMDTTSQEETRAPGPTTFKMYYALSPEMEQTNSIDYLETSAEINSQKQREARSDHRADGDEIGQNENHADTNTEEREGSEEDWRGTSIPPDIVASVNNIKVIRDEPRKYPAPVQVSFDDRDRVLYGDEINLKSDEDLKTLDRDQDVTDYTSMQRQMDAYKNLEDLLDVPWEESDLAPPSKVDVVLRVGGELGERYNNV